MRLHELLALLSLSSAQVGTAGEAYEQLRRLYEFPVTPSLAALPVCFGHGCSTVKWVALDAAAWHQVRDHLADPAPDPAAEREQIRLAVAQMERITGVLAGTADDRAGDFRGFGNLRPQMDCIDESSNTTTYLTLFQQADLLRWHEVEPRAHRGYILFGGWPHYSALIRERESGALWVVDSWFRDNGEMPDVLDLEAWQDGWRPAGFVF